MLIEMQVHAWRVLKALHELHEPLHRSLFTNGGEFPFYGWRNVAFLIRHLYHYNNMVQIKSLINQPTT